MWFLHANRAILSTDQVHRWGGRLTVLGWLGQQPRVDEMNLFGVSTPGTSHPGRRWFHEGVPSFLPGDCVLGPMSHQIPLSTDCSCCTRSLTEQGCAPTACLQHLSRPWQGQNSGQNTKNWPKTSFGAKQRTYNIPYLSLKHRSKSKNFESVEPISCCSFMESSRVAFGGLIRRSRRLWRGDRAGIIRSVSRSSTLVLGFVRKPCLPSVWDFWARLRENAGIWKAWIEGYTTWAAKGHRAPLTGRKLMIRRADERKKHLRSRQKTLPPLRRTSARRASTQKRTWRSHTRLSMGLHSKQNCSLGGGNWRIPGWRGFACLWAPWCWSLAFVSSSVSNPLHSLFNRGIPCIKKKERNIQGPCFTFDTQICTLSCVVPRLACPSEQEPTAACSAYHV